MEWPQQEAKDTTPSQAPCFPAAAMTHSVNTRFRPALVFCSLLVLILGIEYLIIQHPDFAVRPALPAAVTFDLLIWPPVLFYACIVRSYQLPVSSVVVVFAAMLALGQQLLPAGQQEYLRQAKYVLPLFEVAAGGFLVLKMRRLRHAYLQARAAAPDVMANLAAACATVFKRPVDALVFEAALWYYALLSWRTVPRCIIGQQTFSGHRESGFVALLLTFAALSVVEAAAVHLLLLRWSSELALAALLLNVYTLVAFMGHLRAVQLEPVVQFTVSGELLLRAGLVWRLSAPGALLIAVTRITDVPVANAKLLDLAKPLLTPPNLLLTFAEPVTVIGPYGWRRTVCEVAVYVDDPATCHAALLTLASGASLENP